MTDQDCQSASGSKHFIWNRILGVSSLWATIRAAVTHGLGMVDFVHQNAPEIRAAIRHIFDVFQGILSIVLAARSSLYMTTPLIVTLSSYIYWVFLAGVAPSIRWLWDSGLLFPACMVVQYAWITVSTHWSTIRSRIFQVFERTKGIKSQGSQPERFQPESSETKDTMSETGRESVSEPGSSASSIASQSETEDHPETRPAGAPPFAKTMTSR